MGAWTLREATLIELDPPGVERADLVIEDGVIVARGPDLPAAGPVVDCGGAPVMPGLVNAHGHLYSALSRGAPAPPIDDFEQALERLWWPLDRSLTDGDVLASARVGLAEAVLVGTTTLIDHHASPEAIPGSLDRIARAAAEVGVRAAVCYEITDRNGPAGRDAGLAESARAIAAWRGGGCRAVLGAHASFTLNADTLAAMAALPGPLHIHVAEGAGDVADAKARGFDGIVARLDAAGLLRPGSILAHGVHLRDDEVERARAAGCWLVHNPTSNRNNRVGYARPGRFGDRGALGTDGIGSDMLGAAQAAFFAAREHRHDLDAIALLSNNHRLASELLGVRLGRLRPGYAADLIRLDYRPPTPLTTDTLGGHLLFGIAARHVRDVWVAGEPAVVDRALRDAQTIAAGGRAASPGLWARYRARLEGADG